MIRGVCWAWETGPKFPIKVGDTPVDMAVREAVPGKHEPGQLVYLKIPIDSDSTVEARICKRCGLTYVAEESKR